MNRSTTLGAFTGKDAELGGATEWEVTGPTAGCTAPDGLSGALRAVNATGCGGTGTRTVSS